MVGYNPVTVEIGVQFAVGALNYGEMFCFLSPNIYKRMNAAMLFPVTGSSARNDVATSECNLQRAHAETHAGNVYHLDVCTVIRFRTFFLTINFAPTRSMNRR